MSTDPESRSDLRRTSGPRRTSGRRRTHLFASLCGMVFLVNFGRVAFAPLLEPFMRTFGVGEATAGLVATLAWLGSALPRLPTGYLLTRIERHRVVLGAGCLLAGGAAFTAAAPDVALLGAGALLVGSASGVYFVSANPLISELFPDRVGRAMGIHATAAQVAAVLAPVLVGVVLVVGAWWWTFALLGLAAVAVTGSVGLTARGTDLPSAGHTDRDLLGAARLEWRTIAFGVLALGTVGFVWNAVFNFYVPYLTTAKDLPVGTANVLLTVLFAAGVPAMWLAGRLADRFSHVRQLLVIVAGFTAALFALTATTGLLAIAAVTVLLGVVIHALFPTIDTYLLASFPDDRRASAYSTFSASTMIVQATGSLALGTLVEAGFGYDAVLRAFALGLAAVVAGLLVLYRTGRIPGATPG